MNGGRPSIDCPCEGQHFERVFTYDAPPAGEVHFQFSQGGYRREILRCRLCHHFVSTHDMDDTALYASGYVDSTYIDDEGIRQNFDRINALDPTQSDNVGRVRRILEFATEHFAWKSKKASQPSILDVGSGLGVFVYRMKLAGWSCTALDPDSRAAAHAEKRVGVKAVCGDFMAIPELGAFDVVTFNKVLEHMKEPVTMLAKALKHVKKDGFVYIELPDGENAMTGGPHREEFFIDHWHIFSAASAALLASRAGFEVRWLERLSEPSGKYSLAAFLLPV